MKALLRHGASEGLHMALESESLMDERLVLDCQSGSCRGLGGACLAVAERLWRHAYCLTGDAEAAWDVTKENWLGIIRGQAAATCSTRSIQENVASGR